MNPDDDPTRALDGWSPGATRPAPLPAAPASPTAPAGADDPTRLLDGWQPGGGGRRDEDITRTLDGWQPGAPPRPAARSADRGPAPGPGPRGRRPADDDITDIEDVRELTDLSDLHGAIDEQRRTQAQTDAQDSGWQPTALDIGTPPTRTLDDAWQPGRLVQARRRLPGERAVWQPGCWVGVARQVCGPQTEFGASADGRPVVESYPPQMLVAAWPPQGLDQPFLGRWPAQVQLCGIEPDEAPAALLGWLPPGAPLWVSDQDVDWALLAEVVLHHDPSLKPFQLRELRRFADEARDAAFERLNRAYAPAAPGAPVARQD